MLIQNLVKGSYNMKMNVELRNVGAFREVISEEYVIDGIVKFQIRAIIYEQRTNSYGPGHIWIFGKFVNITSKSSICIYFSSEALNITNKHISANSEWHLLPDKYVTTFKFDVYFTVDIMINTLKKFKILYLDEKLTDFELRGDDGSVKIHKFMLAAASPVFYTMLQGDWKETNNGNMHLERMSKATLQHFKQYIYLNTLPPTVSEQILIIAMRYDMPDMETIYIKNLIENLKAENVHDLLEFAVTHKSVELTEAILGSVQYGFIKVDEIKKKRKEINCDTEEKES